MAAAVLVFLGTLALVVWQPRGLGIGWSALGGAGVALASGVVHLDDIPVVWGIVWNATFTFVAVIVVSLVLDACGFFAWAALHVARAGRGRGRLLFCLIVLLGAAIASVFANDGTALILTPIVMEMLLALELPPATSLAFVVATGFIADTSSLPLVVSNLVNIVSADYFHLGFASYAAVMVPVALASVAASLGALLVYFRRRIPRTYDLELLGSPRSAVVDMVTFKAGWVVLVVLLAGYFAAAPLGIPISAVAGAAAAALVTVAGREQIATALGRPPRAVAALTSSPVAVGGGTGEEADSRQGAVEQGADVPDVDVPGVVLVAPRAAIPVVRIVREAPWQIVMFSLGMYLVVYGLRNEGLTADVAHLLDVIGRHGVLASSFGTGFLVAALSSVMNNMPTVLIGALSVHATTVHGTVRQAMVYSNVVGADLGPKITPIGSLATLLWLHVLERKGMKIGWGRYFRIGIVLTPPVLAITLATLAARV